ncbi:MAG: NAD(P)/FAD-dependent oxidoreductase [Desulfatibacillaceae bacterium]
MDNREHLYGKLNAIQVPASNVEQREYDVIVAGAGPAGSAAASWLARSGASVLMLDGAPFPRDKVCGDLLVEDSMQCLRALDVAEEILEAGLETPRFRMLSPSRIPFDVPGRFVTLKREVLDAILAKTAHARGAIFALGRVSSIEETDTGVKCRTDGGATFRAAAAVLATGARVGLMKDRGMATQYGASAVAARCYIRAEKGPDYLLASYDRSIIPGYAWVFPMGGGEYNVGCGVFYNGKGNGTGKTNNVNLRTMFDTFMRQIREAREIRETAVETGPLAGAVLRCGLGGFRMSPAARILPVGESAGATLPFTGEGIGKSMETGRIAAEMISAALASGDFSPLAGYPRVLEERLRHRYTGYSMAQKWLAHAWVVDFLAARARKNRFLRDSAIGIFKETVDPGAVFSVSGMLRAVNPFG